MTRRARGKGRVLGLDAYIHRATLGLPRGERLDAAAELRTHLLERVAEHMAQGFSREEAEYLTVKGMGEPQTVNRGLLGHVFTNRLGWAALAVLLVGGGGWYAYQAAQWEGVRPVATTALDDTAISQIDSHDWPSNYGGIGGSAGGFAKAAEIRFPEGTTHVFAAFLSAQTTTLRSSFSWWVGPPFLKATTDELKRFWQGHFRLVSIAAQRFDGQPCPKTQVQVGNVLYGIRTFFPKEPGSWQRDQHGLTYYSNLVSGFCLNNPGNLELRRTPLALNTWTPVMEVFPGLAEQKQQGTVILLLYSSNTTDIPGRKPEDVYQYDPKAGWHAN
ncbi:permease prefix domain 1-containing protein [Deinococcus radiopugnans]|nr:permease prefix domain 1-containing protein [Deinococcus radiopugnans]